MVPLAYLLGPWTRGSVGSLQRWVCGWGRNDRAHLQQTDTWHGHTCLTSLHQSRALTPWPAYFREFYLCDRLRWDAVSDARPGGRQTWSSLFFHITRTHVEMLTVVLSGLFPDRSTVPAQKNKDSLELCDTKVVQKCLFALCRKLTLTPSSGLTSQMWSFVRCALYHRSGSTVL